MGTGYVRQFGVVLIATAATVVSADAEVLFVDADAVPDGDGATWDTAFRFLQDAIMVSANGTEVRVAQGIYRADRDEANPDGTGDRERAFEIHAGQTLRGGYAGAGAPDPDARDIGLYETILSGDLLGDDEAVGVDDNSYNVVRASGKDVSPTIDGFVITAGNAFGESVYHQIGAGVYFQDGSVVIRSCTFRGNNADAGGGGLFGLSIGGEVSDCTFFHNSGRRGGAMFCNNAVIAIADCLFDGNSARGSGGAIKYFSADVNLIRGSTFTDNVAVANDGGAIDLTGAVTRVHDCRFDRNRADHNGGAIRAFLDRLELEQCSFEDNEVNSSGGAVSSASYAMEVRDCLFRRNRGVLTGGIEQYNGLLLVTGSTFALNIGSLFTGALHANDGAIIRECEFTANFTGDSSPSSSAAAGVSTSSGSYIIADCAFLGHLGRAVTFSHGTGSVTNSVFAANQYLFGGGIAIRSRDAEVVITNTTLAYNRAGYMAGGSTIHSEGTSSVRVVNCIEWHDDEILAIDQEAPAVTTVSYSIITDGWTGPGAHNLDADPRFEHVPDAGPDGDWGTDDDLTDLHLDPTSPAIDAGANAGVAPDLADLDDDGDIGELTPTDLDGAPRFADVKSVPDTGCGLDAIVDMGAYEAPGRVAEIVRGDVDGDGRAGAGDVLEIIWNWGEAEPDCLPDLNTDGQVGMADLLIVLTFWS